MSTERKKPRPYINVMSIKATGHMKVDTSDASAVTAAAEAVGKLKEAAAELGFVLAVESNFGRIPDPDAE